MNALLFELETGDSFPSWHRSSLGVGYNRGMSSESGSRRGPKSPPHGDTGQEAAYLRFLSEKQVPVTVKLRDGESVSGWVEYFDERMIRLTREGRPNLFIYKQQIRTITEHGRRPAKNDGRAQPARGDAL